MALSIEQIQSAYVTFFNRPADAAGLNYWLSFQGSYTDLLNSFSQSGEYTSLYTGNHTQVVAAVYQNLFGRAPDVQGLLYWVGQMDSGNLSIASVANAIKNGAQGTDATIISNKVTAATNFTAALDTTPEVVGYASASSATLGAVKAWLSGVTSDPATLPDANSLAKITATVASGNAATASATQYLTVGQDTLTGTSGADTFVAGVVQNAQGEQTNQLGTGDVINGGAGADVLNATVQAASALNNAPGSAIAPTTSGVEQVNFTALNTVGGQANTVFINAKNETGLTQLASVNSDASLVIDNVTTLTDSGLYSDRRNTESVAVRFDHSSNGTAVGGAANLTVLFDNDYLVAGKQTTDSAYYWLEDRANTKIDPTKPLAHINVDGITFTLNGVTKSIAIASADMKAFLDGTGPGAGTWAGFVTLLQTALNAAKATDTSLANLTITLNTSNVQTLGLDGTVLPEAVPAIQLTATNGDQITPTKFHQYDEATGSYDVYGKMSDAPSVSVADPITVDVNLLKVGRGAEGGVLTIGAENTNGNNVWDYSHSALKEGVDQFNVTVEGDTTQFSNLAKLQSTNNTLKTVNVAWATGSVADLYLGNVNTTGTNDFSAFTAGVRNVSDVQNNALKDVRTLTVANNNTTTAADGSLVTTDASVHASITSESVAKYMDLTDGAADAAADNAAFVYTFGAGNDLLNLNLDRANLAQSGTTNREDFSLSINMGDGNNTVVTQIGDGSGVATDAWYVNSKIQQNLHIVTGAGNDTISTNGAGSWTIDAGAGNDAIYADNSGVDTTVVGASTNGGKAVWVFNTASQLQNSTATAENVNNLTSAQAVAAATKVANLSLTVSYHGLTATVVVGGTDQSNGGTVSDLTINQAIKAAINSDTYLGKLLHAVDGPGNTLVVNSLTDGVATSADISLSLSSAVANAAQIAAGAANLTTAQLNALGFDASGVQVAAGRFDSALGNDGAGHITSGADSIVANSDTIVDGIGKDVVVLSSNVGVGNDLQTVNLSADNTQDVIYNASHALINGLELSDVVIGHNGALYTNEIGSVLFDFQAGATAQLTAQASNSTLVGNAGTAETISLGAALTNNVVELNSTTAADTVLNFNSAVAHDSVALSLAAFSALGAVGNLAASAFESGAGLTDTATATGRLAYNTTNGDLYYDADGSGAGAAVVIGHFTGAPALSAADIHVVA